MIFDSPEANQRLSDTAAEAPPATFMERFQAADKQGQLRGTVLSPGFAVSEDYDRRIKDIKDAGLGDLSDLNPMWNSKPTPRAPHVYSEGHSIYDMEPSKAVEDPHEAFQKKLEQLQRDNPDKAHIIKADKPITGSESYQAAKKAAEDAAAAYGGPPLTGPIADFAGGMWSMRKDPFQVGTLVIGPMSPVRQGAKAVLTMGLKQAAANAAVEASLQPFVQSWRKSMNDSYGWWAAAEEIGMAGAFGLGADAGVRMLYRGAQARMGRKAILDEQGRVTGYESGAKAAEREALTARNLEIQKNLEALPKDTLDKVAQGDEEATIALAKALKADEDPSVGGAINALRNTDRVTLDGIDDGWRERSLIQQFRALEDPSEPAPVHFDAATKAERPRLADDAELPKGTEGNQHYRMLDIDGKPVRFEAVDANRITTDPATFQFKGGRDSAGASNALRAVDFDGRYKGKVIVYEREDGSLVVADGHDRVSLANRAPEPQKLDALIFREKDGWTAEQVRAEAARKNIQEGTGSLMDVAGAIRRHSEIVDDSMAVSTDFMADARSIARLSDEAFDAVAGGQFNPKHGVLVSDHVPDPSRHMEVLRELDRRNPPTEAAARREIGNMLREPANIETLTRVMDIPLAEPHVIEARNDVLAGVADALEGRRQVEQPQFADPETGLEMSAGDVDSVIDMARYVQDMRKVPQPKTLYQWIIETGRLKDQSGELTNILGGKNRQLISGKGRNLDDAARSAWEAGYMQGERPTVDEFLQLVDRSVRGEKIVSLHDADMLEEIRVAREMEQELEQYGVKATASPDEIRQHFTRKGGEGAGGASQAAGRAADPIRLASFARDTEELARARAQGFDTSRTLYHGTGSVIDAFDLAKAKDKEGRQRGLGLGKDKIYLTGNQWSAGEWALNAPDRGLGDAPNVIPVYVRGRLLDEKDYHAKFAELSGGRQIFDSTLTMKERDAIIAKTDKWAKSEGYAGIQQVWRDQTGKIMETGQVAMFDPKDIRSPRAAFRGEGPALLASISYEQQAASAVIRRLSEKPGLVSDTLAQAGRAVAEGQPLERAIDATLRRFEDVIGKAGVKGLADQPVRLSPTDERPRFLATLAGSDAAVGRSMRADLDRLGYYSKALEAAKSLKQSRGTPEQMLAQLKAAGVKDAEIEATNLRSFLDGKTSITRDDIVKHLTENRVGVKEKQYGYKQDGWIVDPLQWGAQGETKRFASQAEAEAYAQSIGLTREHVEQMHAKGKWQNYSLDPSNPTYRETVLHLPSKMNDEMRRTIANGGWVARLDVGDFRSGHFSEPNIIGHMMTSMNRHEGKPVFTLDQIQSDWGQKLRDGGVRDEAKIAKINESIADIEKEIGGRVYDPNAIVELRRQLDAGRTGAFPNTRNLTDAEKDNISNQISSQGALEDLYQRRRLLRAELDTAQALTPGHPLVNTTDQWTNTTLRRALRQAVEADAEFIAIPSGDTVLSYNPGDEAGMRGFYGSRTSEGIVPKNLRKLLEKIDKDSAKSALIDKLETPSGMNGSGFTLFPLTDKVKRSVMEEGQALFALSRNEIEQVWGPKFDIAMGQQYRIAEAAGDFSTMYDILTAKLSKASGIEPEMRSGMEAKLRELYNDMGPEGRKAAGIQERPEWEAPRQIAPADITPTKLNEFAENLRQALDEATTPPPGRLDDPIKDAPKQVERLREDLAEDIAVAMGQPSPAQLAAIRAFHGSPHDFDKFDLSKIGTGEGAQAFGHGLYFAESEGVAKTYRDALGNYDNAVKWKGAEPPTPEQKRIIDQMSGFDVGRNRQPDLNSVRTDITRAINQERMSEGMPGWDAERSARRVADLRKQLETLDGMKDMVEVQPPGRLYEVNIKADPEHFLDWDKPLSQQSEKVQQALKDARRYIIEDGTGTGGGWTPWKSPGASEKLREAGIPGIKYLDQGSRGAGEGSRNYVVFDDSLVEIVAKDGKPVTPEEKKNILADMRRQQAEERAAKQQAEQPQQQAQASPLLDLYQRYSTQGREALDAVMPGTGRMIDEFVQANPEVVARIAEALGAPAGRPQAAQMLEHAMPQFMSPRIIDMSKPVLLTPEANARMPDIRRELDRTVQMLPPEYRIRVEDSLVFNFGDGDKRLDGLHDGYEKLIYVSMAAGDPVRTSRHEVIHALRQSGLMKDEEFAALYKFADRLGLRKAYEIDAQYKEPYTQAYGNRGADFVEQLLREETVANMFSDYSLNGRRFGDVAGGGMVDRLIDMIVSFMKQVRDIMGGYGFRNVYDVFESIESGAMARRGVGQMDGADLASVRQPLDMSPEARKARAEQMGFDTGKVWYHGAARSDRIADAGKFDPKRATSGPMAFFTDDPKIASNYAKGKADTSLNDDGEIAKYFTVSPKDLGDARGRTPYTVEQTWYRLSPEQRADIADKATRVGYENPQEATGPLTLHSEGTDASLNGSHFDYILKTEARGNVLTALRIMWHDSGELFGQPEEMMNIWRLAGYPHKISDKTAPWYEAQGVLPVYMKMRNPLDTSDTAALARVVDALDEAFKRDRSRLKEYGADGWDKNSRYTPKEWVKTLRDDIAAGKSSFVFTSIPDKVTEQLRVLGYDGILDRGGKMGGAGHDVAIPFDPQQVRSVNATFDPAEAGSARLLADMAQDEPPPLARDLADVQRDREGHDVLGACRA